MQWNDSRNMLNQSLGTKQSLPAAIACWLIALLLVLFCTAPAKAQFGSSLSGTVLDSSKAAIPNATVTLTNGATQETKTTTSNGTGFYHFSELAPGSYSIVVMAQGFKKSNETAVAIAAETPREVDVTLQTGGATETVEVNGDLAPLLQTSDASISTTIDSEEIQRLPTFGADPYELIRTAPGITGDGARSGSGQANFLPNAAGPGGSNSGIFQTENQVQISAAGQRQADNNFMVDGVSVNSLTHGGAAVVSPSEEAVGQLTIVSTSLDASDGRNSGAQIKIVTKSGTNELHGSLFGLYDEPGLNAYDKWGGPNGALPERVEDKQRSYAASLGGPVWRNKIFFFASFAGFGTANNTEVQSYVETPQYRAAVEAMRTGSVSARILADPGVLPRIRAILTPSCAGASTYTPTGTSNPVPACKVVTGGLDLGSLTPGGTTQIGVYPTGAPDPALDGASTQQLGGGFDGIPDVENVQLFVPSHSRGNQFNGRGDWIPTQRDQIAGSFYFTKLDNYGTSGSAGSRPQADVPFKPLNSAATAIYIHTFSANWLNEARVNGTRFAENGLRDAGNVTNFGIPFINVQTLPWAIQFGAEQSSTTPAVFAENTYEGRDLVTYTWGSHVLRIGGELRLEQDNDNLLGNQRPVFAMQGLWTMANDAPIYEAIDANPNNGGVPLTQRYFRSDDMAAFAQHDWKVSPNLTLNMGLRWEFFTPLRNKGFAIYYPVLGSTPGQELTGVHLIGRNHLWDAQPRNFAPKFGFAFQPEHFNHKVVIRGGFAVAYNHLDIALFNNALEDGPNVASFGLCCASAATGPNSAGVKYDVGTSFSPSSFPFNPALALGVNSTTGFPCQFGSTRGHCINQSESTEIYGALPNTKQPMSYLYSLETQVELPYSMVGSIGYTGSVGHHYARLVNQNFIYPQCFPATVDCAGTNVSAPVYAAYFAQTDSNQAYDALNLNLSRHLAHGLNLSAYYTYSKTMDQVSNGDAADSDANQTNPANNATEWGPSDYDVRHRFTGTAVYELPNVHSQNALVKAAANGWQINGIATYHTAFPWTPVTYNLQTNPLVPGANVVGPTRPTEQFHSAGSSCSSSAFQTAPFMPGSNFSNSGGIPYYFDINPLKSPSGETLAYTPGIGRNSFRGPCYFDIDMSFAKQFAFNPFDHRVQLRLQGNFYNIFNLLQLQPITNGNANPGANIQSATFGESNGANAGRVVEFIARIQF